MQTIAAKTILTRTKNTAWFGCEYNMNIYKGCSHGCIYCDSRSDCYQIQNFSQVCAKENALSILRDNLSRKIKTGIVSTGSMSDPYNPFEKTMLLTRNALELINAYGFGVAIATKSALITRDIDIFKDIKTHSPVLCKITITTNDDELAKKIEPNVSLPSLRFSAIEKLSSAGVFCGILMMPLLPKLTDTKQNVLAIIEKAAKSGARFIYPSFGLTMRSGQREYFFKELDKQFPEQNLASYYHSMFGSRYYCSSPKTKELWHLFEENCQKHGILYKMQDIVSAYKQGYGSTQLSFF